MQKQIKRKYKTKSRFMPLKGLQALVEGVCKTNKVTELPQFRPGDQIKVHTRISEGGKERIQIYEGVVIQDKNDFQGGSFRVRKISHGVGVERVYMRNSPKIAKVELVNRGKVRRAKLFYLRDLEGKASKLARDYDSHESETTSSTPAPAKV